MKILVVEDGSMQRLLLRRLLEKSFGAQVVEASDGEQGLEKIEEEQVDLVVLDVEMPVMDGPAMLEELRGRPGGADVPVVAVSYVTDKEVVKRMIGLGVLDYLIMPLDWDVVRGRFERLFRHMGLGLHAHAD